MPGRVGLLFIFVSFLLPAFSFATLVPGSMDVSWDAGSPNCKVDTQPAIQVHRYEPQTMILRQNLCLSFEGNFLYLLMGSKQALLIDTGAIADAAVMPLAKTVEELLSASGAARTPLMVVHTHGHTDHRDGDAQFAGLPNVQVAPHDVNGVRAFFGLSAWPEGVAHVDLGERVIDVIPAPGHHPAHVVFYDDRTGLLFTGDFFLPGRLLLEDTAADQNSAARVIAFVKTHPVSYVMGAHIEFDQKGDTFSWGSHYHPQEHALQLTTSDLMQLPAALQAFNGFYGHYGDMVLMNPNRVLAVEGVAALFVVVLFAWLMFRLFRSWRRGRVVAGEHE